MNELKHCPLCGGKAMLNSEEIFCSDCNLTLPIQLCVISSTSTCKLLTYKEARENMIRMWNRRVIMNEDNM